MMALAGMVAKNAVCEARRPRTHKPPSRSESQASHLLDKSNKKDLSCGTGQNGTIQAKHLVHCLAHGCTQKQELWEECWSHDKPSLDSLDAIERRVGD